MKAQTIGLDSIPSNLAIDLTDELSSDVRGGETATVASTSTGTTPTRWWSALKDPVLQALWRFASEDETPAVVDEENTWKATLTEAQLAVLKAEGPQNIKTARTAYLIANPDLTPEDIMDRMNHMLKSHPNLLKWKI